MASSAEYVEFVCEQVKSCGEIRYKKMFGEYMVYVNDRPVIIVCDNTPFVKMHDAVSELLKTAETGFPYDGAKLHYILDVEDEALCTAAVTALTEVTPVPVKNKKKQQP